MRSDFNSGVTVLETKKINIRQCRQCTAIWSQRHGLLSGDELYADVKSRSHITKPDFWKTDIPDIFHAPPSKHTFNAATSISIQLKGLIYLLMTPHCDTWTGGSKHTSSATAKVLSLATCFGLCEKPSSVIFNVLLTVHLNITVVNNRPDAQLLYNTFIKVLYIFRAMSCSSSGGQIVLIQHLVHSLSVSGRPVDPHTGRPLTESDYTRCCISTIWPPDDEHDVGRNM